DLLPTIAAIIGTGLPSNLKLQPDGHNIQHLLTGGPDGQTPYEAFFYNKNGAVRAGKWKYRHGPRYGHWSGVRFKENPKEKQLFNLDEDIGETKNLIGQYPELAGRLAGLLSQGSDPAIALFDPAPPAGRRYEWESGTLSGGAVARGTAVRNMHTPGASVAMEADGGSGGGNYKFTLGYASQTGARCRLLVNGAEQPPLVLPKTGGWRKVKAVKLSVVLRPGQNTIEIRSDGGGGVNLDYMDLQR
ncbi:MAG: carbohydrate-binding domain-containing protein, partial [Verrucomicrobiota bacterium]